MKNKILLLIAVLSVQIHNCQTQQELFEAARQFPKMPRDATELFPFVQQLPLTFGSGTPFNDLEYTIMDFDYIDGENGGGDVFMPVDPSENFPGSNTIKYVRAVLNLDLNESYNVADFNRILLQGS